ncbi:Isoamylase N-terminal domain containing protein [Musa troglodytarum]|uniref:Isoamylase N-terminal domain containing protein n=1 Tax=Musa troglodytarum TaxID=320322 RepID=A0A9E7KKF6_9LILI|nr:Isoamylase N-terminal domain containing protein [Musa troglodytarum]
MSFPAIPTNRSTKCLKMTCIPLPNPSLVLLSSSSSFCASRHSCLRRSPPLLSFLLPYPALSPPRRAHEPLSPSPFHANEPFVRFSRPLRRSRRSATREEDVSGMMEAGADLEAQIHEFMQKSGNPNDSPTRVELIAAGSDTNALGSTELESDGRAILEDSRVSQERFSDNSCGNVVVTNNVLDSEDDPLMAFSSGRLMEIESVGTGGGIEGILSRLERERNLFLSVGKKETSWESPRSNKHFLREAAGDIIASYDKIIVDASFLNSDLNDPKMHKKAQDLAEAGNGTNAQDFDINQVLLRLQHLESDLASALHLLMSRADAVTTGKGQQISTDELHCLSDAREFQETEIVSAQDKLRSTRARMAALEGKMALEIIEAKKLMEEKKKRVDAAQNALSLLRTVCIVWPNSASEVLLAGSFDGWNSQRRMESSGWGIFSLYLKLYPGRYEVFTYN